MKDFREELTLSFQLCLMYIYLCVQIERDS